MVKFLLMISADMEKLTNLQPEAGVNDANFLYSFKCKLCAKSGTVTMVRDSGRPLSLADSKAREFAPLMLFDCRGYEPLDFVYGRGWKAESLKGREIGNIDLSNHLFEQHDEEGNNVRIGHPRAKFEVK
ncbi:uncharacterized protein LOC107814803 [Nicotiana tabacum]|uniref:UPF0587 protein GA18326-like n=1 Tax=Nicotiana tabacum TaxID=4097 RepID=A0A1S4C3K7_TOBAC|nr:PREDICTED: UPF0587 protein GA18326-like [Nicotiana tabacum]